MFCLCRCDHMKKVTDFSSSQLFNTSYCTMRLHVWWLNLLILGVKPHRLDITSKILEVNKGKLGSFRGKCSYCVLTNLLTMLPTCCLNPGISHVLVEGDVALSKKRNAMKCWSDYCKWKKSYNGLVEVPYSFSDYFCEEFQSIQVFISSLGSNLIKCSVNCF